MVSIIGCCLFIPCIRQENAASCVLVGLLSVHDEHHFEQQKLETLLNRSEDEAADEAPDEAAKLMRQAKLSEGTRAKADFRISCHKRRSRAFKSIDKQHLKPKFACQTQIAWEGAL